MANPLQIQINCSGSWANLVTCSPSRLDDAKAACEALASTHLGTVSFKVSEIGTGITLEKYHSAPMSHEPHGWHAPFSK